MHSFRYNSFPSRPAGAHLHSVGPLKSGQIPDPASAELSAPHPTLLDRAATGPALPPMPIKLSPLQPPEYLNPLLLPPMIKWLDAQLGDSPRIYRPASIAGCWSGSETATNLSEVFDSGSLPDPPPAPPPVRQTGLLLLLDEFARYVHKHAIMKPTQQLRDDLLHTSLDSCMPLVLMNLIRDYAAESVLSPLKHDSIGSCFNFAGNLPIWNEIEKIILSDDPDKDLFQAEITRCHGHILLDSIIYKTMNQFRNEYPIRDSIYLNQGELQKARSDRRLLTSYLTHAQCKALLDQEMASLEEVTHCGRPEKRSVENVELLIEAIQRIPPKAEQRRRQHELVGTQAELMLIQARAKLTGRNEDAACQLFFRALQHYCNIREKRKIIELGIELLRHSSKTNGAATRELIRFFGLLKELCLSYPADGSSYVRLMFAVDALMRQRNELALLAKLYQATLTNPPVSLPIRYRDKMLYRWIVAEHRTGVPDRIIAKRILNGLEAFRTTYDKIQIRPPDPPMQSADLNPVKFLHYFAHMFQLLAVIARSQLDQLDQLNAQQQQEIAALFTTRRYLYDGELLRRPDGFAALRCSQSASTSPFDCLLHAAAEYQKSAIKILIKAHSLKQHQKQTEKLLVAQFDNLADFYHKYEKIDALEQLLERDNVMDFLPHAGFESMLATWRESLQSTREAAAKSEITY